MAALSLPSPLLMLLHPPHESCYQAVTREHEKRMKATKAKPHTPKQHIIHAS